MGDGRRGDDGAVDFADQFAEVSDRAGARFLRQGLAGFGTRVDHGDQLDLRNSGGELRVNLSQMTDADHGETQATHAALRVSRPRPCLPTCCPSMNARSISTSGE